MLQLSILLRQTPELLPVSEYCRLKEKGVRKGALEAIGLCLEQTLSYSRHKRLSLAMRLLELHYTFPQVRNFLCYPLLEEFIRPSLRIMAHPGNEAFRELALLDSFMGKGMPALRIALRYAPSDNAVRGRIVSILLQQARYAMHRLEESRFIGREEKCGEILQEAADLLRGHYGESPYLDSLAKTHQALSGLLEEWMAYKNEASDILFPQWKTLSYSCPPGRRGLTPAGCQSPRHAAPYL